MKRKILTALMILAFTGISGILLQAQDNSEEENILMAYDLGDQIFSVNAGLFAPLFFHLLNGNGGSIEPAYSADLGYAHLSAGGTGSLEWCTFVNSNLTVGFELGGVFSFTPNKRTLVMIPITGQAAWNFRAYPFEFPVFLGAGIVFNILDDSLFLSPILKPGASAYYIFNSEWSFGMNMTYWWVPEIYFDDAHAGQSAFGNFLEISISAIRHF